MEFAETESCSGTGPQFSRQVLNLVSSGEGISMGSSSGEERGSEDDSPVDKSV